MNRLILPTAVALLLAMACPFAKADLLWVSRPYEIDLQIESTCSGLTESQLVRLRRQLIERLNIRLTGFWKIRSEASQQPIEEQVAPDKVIRLGVIDSATGYRVHATEEDRNLNNDLAEKTMEVQRVADLPERLYEGALAVFRPVARFQRDPENSRRVKIDFRAASLAPTTRLASATAGDLLLPYRRNRTEDTVRTPATTYPWTFLVAEGETGGGAKVISHSRRPFGTRPSARFDQLAIAAPIDPQRRTRLHLHALKQPDVGLPGYEVSLGRPGESSVTPLGYTDSQGTVELPNVVGVWMAHVKCGSLVVASIPVAPGSTDRISVPLIDERSRLRAELEITSLREELVDTVARRKILAGRIDRFLQQKNVSEARRLLSQIDSLPGRSQFTRRLESAQRSAESSHPVAKARLDRLFTKTMATVSSALDPREVRDLANAVTAAEAAAKNSTSAEQPTNRG